MNLLSEYGTKISDVARQYFLPTERNSQSSETSIDDTFRQLLQQKMNIAMNLNDELQWRDGNLSSITMPSFTQMMQQMMFQSGPVSFSPLSSLPSLNQVVTNYAQQGKIQQDYSVPSSVTNSQQRANLHEIDSVVREASERYGVDEKLIHAIIKMESNYNPNVVSRAGAVGLMQLMPVTAREVGVTDRYDIRQNVFGGTAYFSKMLQRHNGDVRLALASYNAGPGNVKKYGGIPPFKETQNYIKKVIDYYVS